MARKDQQELTPDAMERIQGVVRSMQDDQVERGITLASPMRCDSCGGEKPSAGSALYGAYKLCNDCLLDFTVALASGRVSNVADFMTRRTDEPSSIPPADLNEHRERSSVSYNSRLSRDSLMPSNEPL